MNKKIFLYGHNGSGNHGCEAIVRSTAKILKGKKITLASNGKDEDEKYGLTDVVTVVNEQNKIGKLSPSYINAYINLKVIKNGLASEELPYKKTFYGLEDKSIAFSIGGDNYCYPGYERFIMLHNMLRRKGHKTVLWGCSVEESKMDKQMEEDFKNYDLIVARETLTLETLKKIKANVKLYPDPAFQLNTVFKDLPKGFEEGNTVGINISPMIMNNETKKGIAIENYKILIKNILKNTDMKIALIPHVIWEDNNDDRIPSKELYNEFKDSNRVILIEDSNCEVLKGYIKRCRIFIGARTHSTIAAYSSLVPTLVIGYSVKAKGIAKDIFGEYKNYVIPVQELKESNDLSKAFNWIYENEEKIKNHLIKFMPNYCEKALDAAKEIEVLLSEG